MSDYYLKPNVVLEPLIDRWYAWTHLVAPYTAAMNITGRHIPIMDSYIQAPKIHAAAVKNPKMLGGPFMDFPYERVDDVKALRQETIESQADLIAFSNALKDLNKLLQAHPTGYSLEPIYSKIPQILKGYVELVYDINHNPSFRFYEKLLYRSPFFKTSSHSIALWATSGDERPFVLSTPRLDSDNVLRIDVPLNHDSIDYMSSMKTKPKKLDYLFDIFSIKNGKEQKFKDLFTQDTPKPYSKYNGDKVRMRYFGHACILVETEDISVLVDPLISYYGYQSDINRFSDQDLPEKIDFALITHNHQDHILLETLLPLRHRIDTLVIPAGGSGSMEDPNLKLIFLALGFKNVIELQELDSVTFGNTTISGLPFMGEHCDLNIRTKLCYHLTIGRFSMLFVADSCILEPDLYKHVHKITGDIDVIFLGMECDGAPLSWLYGPLLFKPLSRENDQSRRLAGSNFQRGMDLVDVFNPKEIYVYAMGMEPWLTFISSIKYTDQSNPIIASNKLIDTCRSRGIIAERLFGEKELYYSC